MPSRTRPGAANERRSNAGQIQPAFPLEDAAADGRCLQKHDLVPDG